VFTTDQVYRSTVPTLSFLNCPTPDEPMTKGMSWGTSTVIRCSHWGSSWCIQTKSSMKRLLGKTSRTEKAMMNSS
jgi:hypothetical protein